MAFGQQQTVVLLPSGARTTTQTSTDIVTADCQSLTVFVDTTVFGTGSVTVTINTKDPASGKYILLLSSVAIVATGTIKLTVDPRIAAAANTIAQALIGSVIQIVATANNANSQTYSIGYILQ